VNTSAFKRSSTTPGYASPSLCSPGCASVTGSLQKNDQANASAQGLIKSNARNDQQNGVRLLSEIFRTSPERRRECLYYLALGNYKLGNYSEARRYNDLLLEKEPANLQAGSLRSLIDDKVAKEGLMGVAILSGVAIAAGVVGGMIFRGVGRKR
jgi:fission 1 protein